LAALAVLIGAVSEAVAVALTEAGPARWGELSIACAIAAYAVVGLLVIWHHPRHVVGWLAVLIVPVWGVGQALVAASYQALQRDPASTPAALLSVAGTFLRGLPWLVAVAWLPLVFPDGWPAHPTRLRRTARVVATVTVAAFSLTGILSPTLSDLRVGNVDNPVGLPHSLAPAMDAFGALTLLSGIVAIGLSVACLVQQYRRGGALGRQQTAVFGIAFLCPVAGLVLSFGDAATPLVFGLTSLPVPVALGVAVLQRRLYDIPLLVNRSLAYGTLWLAIAGLYAVVIAGVGSLLQRRGAAWLPWVAAGVVAVSFAPLRDALQAASNRVVYGQWSRPGDVLAATARRLGDATDVPALLESLVEEVGTGLGLRYVEITDPHGRTLAAFGTATSDLDRLPMTSYGAIVGYLAWARRPLRHSDRELLVDLARQLGTVAHAQGLLDAVRASQERLVSAREEERRRLRRDLHDGLGPALASLGLRVDTMRNRLGTPGGGSPETDAALLTLRSGIQATVGDVRRIVEGLRPPALDELGLVEAVRQLADGLVAGTTLQVRVDARELPRLPAATEVAAYRILQEALTNAVRHARAQRVCVRVGCADGSVDLQVSDDGTGVLVPREGGIGLAGMRERAEEIGGTFVIDAEPGDGTTITVHLPVPTPATAAVP
jgi:signal transduction histidine kinase